MLSAKQKGSVMRAILVAIVMLVCAVPTTAQDLSGLARVDVERSKISDGWFGTTELTLALSQGVPYRVFSLSDPARLVIDFREVDFAGVAAAALLPETGRIAAVRFGAFRPGWSRLVLDLGAPLVPKEIAMPVDPSSGQAMLSITLKEVSAEDFAGQAGPPADADWGVQAADQPAAIEEDGFVVVIDPGHGGIDPGAVRDTTSEKELMLGIGLALRDALRRAGGVEVVLTRDTDTFVSLTGPGGTGASSRCGRFRVVACRRPEPRTGQGSNCLYPV